MYERNLRIARSQSHHVSMLTSFSTHLLPTLALGADGILSGHGSVIAELQAQLFESFERGDSAGANAAYERIQFLTRAVYRSPLADMYTRMKEQLVMLGRLRLAVVRPPLPALGEVERDVLREALVAAGLLGETASSRVEARSFPSVGNVP
jgi:4-hydroxy-tetrahydrodipicolinate synthase